MAIVMSVAAVIRSIAPGSVQRRWWRQPWCVVRRYRCCWCVLSFDRLCECLELVVESGGHSTDRLPSLLVVLLGLLVLAELLVVRVAVRRTALHHRMWRWRWVPTGSLPARPLLPALAFAFATFPVAGCVLPPCRAIRHDTKRQVCEKKTSSKANSRSAWQIEKATCKSPCGIAKQHELEDEACCGNKDHALGLVKFGTAMHTRTTDRTDSLDGCGRCPHPW